MAPSERQMLGEEGMSGSAEVGRRLSVESDLSDYCLPWLFDPHRHDHLPIEEQLGFYKRRDLRKVKIFKIATQMWGAPLKRKRVIEAPPMDRNRYNDDTPARTASFKLNSKTPMMNSRLRPQLPPVHPPTEAEVNAQNQNAKIQNYKKWIVDRKQLRSDLDNMGLSEDWLARKPERTALENKVLHRMIEERSPKHYTPPPPEEEPLEAVLPDESPIVKRPSPLAIQIIEQFLHNQRMRLIDLFSSVDKDKNWQISRQEFRTAVQKAQIPISEVLLEDLILALDVDLNDQLDYRELAKGMGLWRIEKRESKRKLISSNTIQSPTKLSQISGFESPERQLSMISSSPTQVRSRSPDAMVPSAEYESSPRGPMSRIKSALSTISTTSSHLLEPPPRDLRLEQRLRGSEEAMVDQRKRDRVLLNRITSKNKSSSGYHGRHQSALPDGEAKHIIKTGDRLIDNHCSPSTLEGTNAEMIDDFRQLKLREYNDIKMLCAENSVPLSEKLLAKVLLYPPDKSHSYLERNLRQPANPLLSNTFADPPKRAATPVDMPKLKPGERLKVTKSGRLTVQRGGKHAYPSAQEVAPLPTKMNLSTGKTVVRRQVDCWMTFEEYDMLTRKMAKKYAQLHGQTNDNAFWPGRLLDKVRLCMTKPDPKTSTDPVFSSIKDEKKIYPGYDNNLNNWPMTNEGVMQPGTIDSSAKFI